MSIQSTTLTSKDYPYFIDNFKVVDSNVDSIEEADCILLGDIHDSSTAQIKKLWLFNRLVKANDKLLVEGESGRLKIYTFSCFPYLPPDRELHGWDSIEVHDWNRQAMFNVDRILSLFEDCMTTPSRIGLIKTIKKVSELTNHKIFNESIKKVKELNPAYTEYDRKLINGNQGCIFESLFGIQKEIAGLAKMCESSDEELTNISDTQLHEFFSFFYGRVQTFLMTHFVYISLIFIMFDRNVSLAKSIAKSCEKGKQLFVIAGRDHLKPGKHIAGRMGYEVLMGELKHRKFIILFPTEDKKNVRDMAIDLISQRKMRYLYPVICSVAISIFFGLTGGFSGNLILRSSCASISLISLGILAYRFKNLMIGTTPKKEKLYDYRFIIDLPRRWQFLDDKIPILKFNQ